MSGKQQLLLSAAIMHGLGQHPGAWRSREGAASDYVSPQFYAELARVAEAGKLHALFLAEQMTNRDTGAERPCGAMDVVAVLSYMAAVTSRIGLVGTGSTTYNQPYDLARRFATLDHLAAGRVGWNLVTTANPATAEMYGTDSHPKAEDRYSRAEEFIDVVTDLWTSWEADALVGDKVNAVFAKPSKIHEINHAGQHFSVRGPLPFPRSRQGRPVVFQAGSSPRGRALAARTADVVFTAQHTVEGAREFRSDIRSQAEQFGRDPNSIKICPGLHVILGRTQSEADDKKAAVENALTVEQKLRTLARYTGIPIASLRDQLDRPFPVAELPPDSQFDTGTGWRRSIANLAVAEGLTVRQLMARSPSAHHHIVGTAEMVADVMMERIEAGAADGFTMMVDVLPESLRDITELLVPELQRRGVFHEDYEHNSLRGSLSIGEMRPVPAQRPALDRPSKVQAIDDAA